MKTKILKSSEYCEAFKNKERGVGMMIKPTDLAILLGVDATDWYGRPSNPKKDYTCTIYNESSENFCMFGKGEWVSDYANRRDFSFLPALFPEFTSKITPQNIKEDKKYGIKTCEYGEYPQTVVNKTTSDQLEKLFQSETLHPTGKKYTFDSVSLSYLDTDFEANSHEEYEYKGKKYIRVLERSRKGLQLSNGEMTEGNGKPHWVRVEPIEWVMAKRGGTWITRKCLFSGIQFCTRKREAYCSKDEIFIYKYLKEYFDYEILPTKEYLKAKGISLESVLQDDCKSMRERLATLAEDEEKLKSGLAQIEKERTSLRDRLAKRTQFLQSSPRRKISIKKQKTQE